MKRVWVSLLCLCAFMTLSAQDYERLSVYESKVYGKQLHLNGSYDAMAQVRDYWHKEYNRLLSDKYQMTLCGNGESVLKISMPSRLLFDPNEASMLPLANGMLRPLLRLVRGDEAVATLIVACYSDNNGSEAYLDDLTQARAKAISQWFKNQGVTTHVASYGMGNHVPQNQNASIEQREHNRRVALYLVPNRQMMKLARKKKLVD